jgi:hypothetical protein
LVWLIFIEYNSQHYFFTSLFDDTAKMKIFQRPLPSVFFLISLFFISLFFGALLLASCNLFTPRTPEAPQSIVSPTLAWQPPTVSDIVLVNLANAFASLNAIDYARTFSPAPTTDNFTASDFVFTPAPETAGSAGTLFQNWTIVSERRFFENFRSQVQRGASPQFQITIDERNIGSTTELQLSVSYRLTTTYNATDIPTVCRGKAVLRLVQSPQGFWYIREWRDFKGESDFTISELKRRLIN